MTERVDKAFTLTSFAWWYCNAMYSCRPIAVAIVCAACGGSTGAAIDAPTPDAPRGANTITGSVGGTPFNTVAASYWVGMPDSPTTDTVTYVFDRDVPCSALTNAGWDATLPTGTQILELKMVGKSPAVYPVTANAQHVPAAGESVAAYSVAGPAPADNFSTTTSIRLSTIGSPSSGQFASGSFQLTLSGGMLSGTYDAVFCATGREP